MGYRYVEQKDSFAQWFIDEFGIDKFNTLIIHEKNIENEVDIWHISSRSMAEIWFRCENKSYHEYCMPAYRYYKGARCKYCGRTKYVHPLDSFGQYIVDNYGKEFLDKIWSDKNTKSPFEYTVKSQQKAYFNCCKCGTYIGKSQIKNYVTYSKMCPSCRGIISSLHEKVIGYLKSKNIKYKRQHDCDITPVNPVTHYPLPYDVELVQYKLIIEINGRQHYFKMSDNSPWLEGMTSIEYFAKRQKYDEFKKQYALQNGYDFLQIPYWAEQKDKYKQLIDKKIEQIQHARND